MLFLLKQKMEDVMEKERREKMALTLAYKKTQLQPEQLPTREQNSIAGQLHSAEGKQMFPGKKGKKAFTDFLERCKTGEFVEGDGEIAVALIVFNYRRKMASMRDSKDERENFKPELTEKQVVELFVDKEYAPLDFDITQKLEFAQFVNWLKRVAYQQVTRSNR